MLKLSFNIKNIQNPLQRHYCRGQTVLSFEQNLIEDTEDTDETEKKVRENYQNNCKRQYGSNCIVLWSKDLFRSKEKISTMFFSSNSSKREKGWIRSN